MKIYIKSNCNIEPFGSGYIVFFEGDELYFDTYEDAAEFCKEVGLEE